MGRRAAREPPPLTGHNEPLVQDGTEHADPITECAQVADAIHPGAFETRNLSDGKTRCRDTDVNERLDLKAIAPEALTSIGRQGSLGIESQDRKVALPEDVEAIAQIRVSGAAEQIDYTSKYAIAEGAQASDVLAASTLSESCSLGEISSVEKSQHETRDLVGVGGAIGVDHSDNIASSRHASASKGVTFA
jgi:hypothetical protein